MIWVSFALMLFFVAEGKKGGSFPKNRYSSSYGAKQASNKLFVMVSKVLENVKDLPHREFAQEKFVYANLRSKNNSSENFVPKLRPCDSLFLHDKNINKTDGSLLIKDLFDLDSIKNVSIEHDIALENAKFETMLNSLKFLFSNNVSYELLTKYTAYFIGSLRMHHYNIVQEMKKQNDGGVCRLKDDLEKFNAMLSKFFDALFDNKFNFNKFVNYITNLTMDVIYLLDNFFLYNYDSHVNLLETYFEQCGLTLEQKNSWFYTFSSYINLYVSKQSHFTRVRVKVDYTMLLDTIDNTKSFKEHRIISFYYFYQKFAQNHLYSHFCTANYTNLENFDHADFLTLLLKSHTLVRPLKVDSTTDVVGETNATKYVLMDNRNKGMVCLRAFYGNYISTNERYFFGELAKTKRINTKDLNFIKLYYLIENEKASLLLTHFVSALHFFHGIPTEMEYTVDSSKNYTSHKIYTDTYDINTKLFDVLLFVLQYEKHLNFLLPSRKDIVVENLFDQRNKIHVLLNETVSNYIKYLDKYSTILSANELDFCGFSNMNSLFSQIKANFQPYDLVDRTLFPAFKILNFDFGSHNSVLYDELFNELSMFLTDAALPRGNQNRPNARSFVRAVERIFVALDHTYNTDNYQNLVNYILSRPLNDLYNSSQINYELKANKLNMRVYSADYGDFFMNILSYNYVKKSKRAEPGDLLSRKLYNIYVGLDSNGQGSVLGGGLKDRRLVNPIAAGFLLGVSVYADEGNDHRSKHEVFFSLAGKALFGPEVTVASEYHSELHVIDSEACDVQQIDPYSYEGLKLHSEVAGKTVMLLRGGCNFIDKVRNMQKFDASSVIVADYKRAMSDEGGIYSLIQMISETYAEDIVIPSVYVPLSKKNFAQMLNYSNQRMQNERALTLTSRIVVKRTL